MHLYQALLDYYRRDTCPLHMPGHKRRALHSPTLPWHMDISEIDGFDQLHAPAGVLSEAQIRAARLWGSDAAYFLINGSTGGLLAGICACSRPGDKILMARNCHKAVYHAVEILALRPVYLDVPLVAGTGIAGSVPPKAVERVLTAHPDVRLAVITSPTYEGVVSDVQPIAACLHRRNIPLLVDEAHGAHLGLHAHFPPSAVSQGADLVVQSLHKTLPSLTQTAVLHRIGERVSEAALRHALGVFQSTSPSYLFLAAMDGCVSFLEAEGAVRFAAWRARLDTFYSDMTALRHLNLLDRDTDSRHICAHDPGKLTILCGETTLHGGAMMTALRETYGIELEMAADGYALAMTSIADTDEDFARLGAALRQLDDTCKAAPGRLPIALPPLPEQAIPAGEALRLPGRQVRVAESVGALARGYVWAYPPGVPLVTPGARITQAAADTLALFAERGIRLHSTFGSPPGVIEVIDKC